jgi:hypothetical protein
MSFVLRLILAHQQRLPDQVEFGEASRSANFLYKSPGSDSGTAPCAKPEHANGVAASALRHGDRVANSHDLIGLFYCGLVDRNHPSVQMRAASERLLTAARAWDCRPSRELQLSQLGKRMTLPDRPETVACSADVVLAAGQRRSPRPASITAQ